MSDHASSPGVLGLNLPEPLSDADALALVMQDMAQAMLSAQGSLSMVGRSAFWTDAEIIDNVQKQLAWGLERWESTRAEGDADA